jgi:hypothetical protein
VVFCPCICDQSIETQSLDESTGAAEIRFAFVFVMPRIWESWRNKRNIPKISEEDSDPSRKKITNFHYTTHNKIFYA